jgi:hypothetical protein
VDVRRVAIVAVVAGAALAVVVGERSQQVSDSQLDWCLAERPALLREAEAARLRVFGSMTDAMDGADARADPFYRAECLREYEAAHGT